jgi:hypothetical protein
VTDRAVQPEAPTTEAGRRLVENAMRYGLIDVRRQVLAIEAEAYRQGWDANTATSFGNRAASQERPQPDATIALGRLLGRVQQMYEDWPTLDMEIEADIAQAKVAIESAGVAQERPSIDVLEAAFRTANFSWARTGDHWNRAAAIALDEALDALTGGSVASPEPTE